MIKTNNIFYRYIFLIVFCISCNQKTTIKEVESADKLDTPIPEIVNSFYIKYESTGIKSAIEYTLNNNKWIELNNEKKDSIISEINNLSLQMGDYHGYEIIKNKNFGKSYKIISSIAKYDRQPIRYNFILYKPIFENEWQLQSFNFDLDLESELTNNISVSYDF